MADWKSGGKQRNFRLFIPFDACRNGSSESGSGQLICQWRSRRSSRCRTRSTRTCLSTGQVHLTFLERRSHPLCMPLANFLRCWLESCSTYSYTRHAQVLTDTCAIHSLTHIDFLERKKRLSSSTSSHLPEGEVDKLLHEDIRRVAGPACHEVHEGWREGGGPSSSSFGRQPHYCSSTFPTYDEEGSLSLSLSPLSLFWQRWRRRRRHYFEPPFLASRFCGGGGVSGELGGRSGENGLALN